MAHENTTAQRLENAGIIAKLLSISVALPFLVIYTGVDILEDGLARRPVTLDYWQEELAILSTGAVFALIGSYLYTKSQQK